MTIQMSIRSGVLAGAAITALTLGAAQPTQAQTTLIPGVTGCDAPGGQQTGGALIGALVGGALGNGISHHNREVGTVAGAALGAGLGSYVGCQRQEVRAREYGYQQPYGYQHPVYQSRYAEPVYSGSTGYQDVRYAGERRAYPVRYADDGYGYYPQHRRYVTHVRRHRICRTAY